MGIRWIHVSYATMTTIDFLEQFDSFQYVIRRRHFNWWTKYNCAFIVLLLFILLFSHFLDVLSAGLDAGVAISVVIIFFWYAMKRHIWLFFMVTDLYSLVSNSPRMEILVKTRSKHGGVTCK
jgi:hypothetical protein